MSFNCFVVSIAKQRKAAVSLTLRKTKSYVDEFMGGQTGLHYSGNLRVFSSKTWGQGSKRRSRCK